MKEILRSMKGGTSVSEKNRSRAEAQSVVLRVVWPGENQEGSFRQKGLEFVSWAEESKTKERERKEKRKGCPMVIDGFFSSCSAPSFTFDFALDSAF